MDRLSERLVHLEAKHLGEEVFKIKTRFAKMKEDLDAVTKEDSIVVQKAAEVVTAAVTESYDRKIELIEEDV